jgi:hypothetical protein
VALIPAICQSCGVLFVTDNVITGEGVVTFTNNSVGPCPACHVGEGRVIDGTYQLAGNVARLLGSPTVSTAALHQLRALLEEVRGGTTEPAVAVDRINREIPEASRLAWLLGSRSRSVAAWIAVIIAVITLILMMRDKESKATPLTPQQIEQIVQQVEQERAGDTPPITRLIPKVGRNELCPCGSG